MKTIQHLFKKEKKPRVLFFSGIACFPSTIIEDDMNRMFS